MPFLLLCFFRYSILSLLFLEWEQNKKQTKKKTQQFSPSQTKRGRITPALLPGCGGKRAVVVSTQHPGPAPKAGQRHGKQHPAAGNTSAPTWHGHCPSSAHLHLLLCSDEHGSAEEMVAELSRLWPGRMGRSQRGGLGVLQFVVLAEQQDAPCWAQLPSQCTLKAAHQGHRR